MLRRLEAAALAALTLTATTASAADWTRWLGPAQNGSSPETGVFSGTPTLEVGWKRPLGIAYSAISVVDGKVVTMYGDGETDWLVALSATDGERLWQYRIDTMFPKVGGAHGGQLGMPVVADDTVYGLAARGQLFAVRLDDGGERWTVRIDEKLGARQPHFGFTSTPLVVGDRLIVQTGGPDGRSLTAIDRATGAAQWSSGDDPVGYQSPVLTEIDDRRQVVAATNRSVLGLSPDDGTVLWRHEHGLNERDGWSTPIALGDGCLLLTARNESAAYCVTEREGKMSVTERWRNGHLKGNFAMPVVHERHVYGYDGSFLTCVDARTGDQKWKARSDAAGLVLVDGHLVILASDGTVKLGEASPDGFEVRAEVEVLSEGGYTFPSFSGGSIYVRNLESVARVDVRRAAGGAS